MHKLVMTLCILPKTNTYCLIVSRSNLRTVNSGFSSELKTWCNISDIEPYLTFNKKWQVDGRHCLIHPTYNMDKYTTSYSSLFFWTHGPFQFPRLLILCHDLQLCNSFFRPIKLINFYQVSSNTAIGAVQRCQWTRNMLYVVWCIILCFFECWD